MNGPTADRAVVLAIVGCLGVVAVLGMAGVIWLVHDQIDPASIAIVVGPVSAALGALGALLASTRTTVAATQQAEAQGFARAVDAVKALDPAPLDVVVVNENADPVPVAEKPAPRKAAR